jgi:hypothetical protein
MGSIYKAAGKPKYIQEVILGVGLPGPAPAVVPISGLKVKGIEIRVGDRVVVLKDNTRGKIVDFFQIGNKRINAIIESNSDVYSFDVQQYGIEFVLYSKSNQKTA